MTTQELADKHGKTAQYIQKISKKQNQKGLDYIELDEARYSFELTKAGRGRPFYFYTKVEHKEVEAVEIEEQRFSDTLTKAQKEKLNLKLRIITTWFDFKREKRGGVDEFIEYVKDAFRTHYTKKMHYDWQKAYKDGGARALVDTRGNKKGKTKLSEAQQRFLIQQFRAFGAGEINYTQIWEELHKFESRSGFDFMAWKTGKVKSLCDVSVVQRFINNYYEKRRVEWTLITKGVDLNKSYNQPAMGKRAESYTYKNECWEIDSTPADVIIFEDGKQMRPDIIAIKDCFSGRCVAHLAEKSNKLAIIRLLWKAIETLGKPKFIKGDNGKDYLSKQFQNLLDNLGIKYDRATAFAGDEKGMVERNFRTIQHSYMRSLAGFIGHNVAHRQKIEQQVAKKDRKAKDKYGNNVMTQIDSDELLNWEQFDSKLQEAVFLWEIDKQRRKGESPIEKWNSCVEPIKKISYESFLVYAGGSETRVVQKDGVHFEGRRFISSFIHRYIGQKVIVTENIDDISELFIFDMDGKLVGVCMDSETASMSKEDFLRAKKEFNKEVSALSKEIRNDKLSARSKENIKVDLDRAKEAFNEELKPTKEIVGANVELQRDVKEARVGNLLDKASKKVVTDDPFLRYA